MDFGAKGLEFKTWQGLNNSCTLLVLDLLLVMEEGVIGPVR